MNLRRLSFPTGPVAIHTATGWIRVTAETLGGLFFPRRCLACGADLPEAGEVNAGESAEEARWLCAGCREAAGEQRIKLPRCAVCSEPFDGAIAGPFECANCRGQDFAFTCAVAARRSRGLVHELIGRFKYHGEFSLRRPLAGWLGEALADERFSGWDGRPAPAALVPVPLFARRGRERGFNQAAVLARLVGRSAGLPVLGNRALRRVRETETQTHLSREERRRNLRGAFVVPHPALVRDRELVLVDDVFTTGSTAHECARTLRAAGAAGVRVIAVARR